VIRDSQAQLERLLSYLQKVLTKSFALAVLVSVLVLVQVCCYLLAA
jgi:hypothetical protein